jgi:hypothetical protein
MKNMKTEIIKITPQMAKKWIENANHYNPRKIINWNKVRTYSQAMKDGLWTLTHQGIAFDKRGNVVDGQHRLHGIIEANIPVWMMVTTGVDISAVPDMDQGLKRDTATLLNIDRRHAGVVAFLSRLVINQTPTRYDLETMRAIILKDIDRLILECGTSRAKTTSSPIRAAFVYFEQKHPKQNVFDQYRNFVLLDLRKLETIKCVSTCLRALHQRVTGNNGVMVKNVVSLNPNDIFAYTVYALKNPNTSSLRSVNVESLLSECRDFYRKSILS